jgi:hypothetical protein
MKTILRVIGKILGFLGKADSTWGKGLALLEPLASIVTLVQAIKGPGNGQEKRKLAIELFEQFLIVEGILAKPLPPDLQAELRAVVGEGVDFVIALGKVLARAQQA